MHMLEVQSLSSPQGVPAAPAVHSRKGSGPRQWPLQQSLSLVQEPKGKPTQVGGCRHFPLRHLPARLQAELFGFFFLHVPRFFFLQEPHFLDATCECHANAAALLSTMLVSARMRSRRDEVVTRTRVTWSKRRVCTALPSHKKMMGAWEVNAP